MESCSEENLTHDVRYQAAIQRPQPNYVKYPVFLHQTNHCRTAKTRKINTYRKLQETQL